MWRCHGINAKPSEQKSSKNDEYRASEIRSIDVAEQDTGTDGSKQERLDEEPEFGEKILRLVMTPYLVRHIAVCKNPDVLGLVEMDQMTNNWSSKCKHQHQEKLNVKAFVSVHVLKPFAIEDFHAHAE